VKGSGGAQQVEFTRPDLRRRQIRVLRAVEQLQHLLMFGL
jgi:hypothetical protein